MSEGDLSTFISEQQCKQILKKYNEEQETNLKLLRYTLTIAKDAKGFLGEYFHLIFNCLLTDLSELSEGEIVDTNIEEASKKVREMEVQCDMADDDEIDVVAEVITIRFFIKKLPQVPEGHEKVAIFRKESSLYSSLLSDLQEYSSHQWCPKAYLCAENFLVLQDLESFGYRSFAYKDNLEDSEMLPILKGLANMHASSFLYELNNKCIEETYCDCLNEITVHPEIPWFTTGIKALLEIAKLHPKYQCEISQKFITEELPDHLSKIYFMVNPSKKYRNVVCHRDTWGGNIFINPEDSEASALFVDFQTCRYCPPVIDVIFTLFMNLNKMQRLEKQNEYLQYYWQQLQMCAYNNMKDDQWGLSENEFLESFEEFQLFGLVYRALAVTILKVPKEFVTDAYKNEERSQKLLQYMEENAEFRGLIEECLEDIIKAVL